MEKTPREILELPPSEPVCCCGPGMSELPQEPLESHSLGCLIWDWAMAVGKITPAFRMEQLHTYARGLGAR